MQLTVRKKVANGLVLFLLVPKAGVSASELYETYADGFSQFTARDDFDIAGERESLGSDTATVKVKSGSDVEGTDPTGGDPTGGDPTGGDPTGGDPTGGDPTGGDPTGGDPTGGDPTGGDPTGGDPTGGDPTGGDPTGGDPTGGDPTGGDPSGYDPSEFDPDGYDPSGGDPSGCMPASAPQNPVIEAPRQLVTAEDGSTDLFQISMPLGTVYPRTFHIVSSDPGEARVDPDVVQLGDDACIPRSIQVIGQNDYLIDGDAGYSIEVRDEQDFTVGQIAGVNLDNDDYTGVAVDVLGPTSLPQGGNGLFLVRVANVSGDELKKNTLLIETTAQLDITDYATALLSGNKFKGKGKTDKKSGALVFKGVNIGTNDMLIVSVNVKLDKLSVTDQAVSARFVSAKGKHQTDDDEDVRSAVP
ncbi:hypothetical protein [Elongatibacter sediminis]|uniref:DUF5666 domain-containing protein n=1 Tax=Elongatibacter sediminis TaxID=3119006 RepID=A0AAW9RC03_9GAMM